jgi:hypothetical protein
VKVWYKSLTNVLAIDDLSTEKKLTKTEYKNIDTLPETFFVNYTRADNVSRTIYYKGAQFDVLGADEIVAIYSGSTPIAVKVLKYTVGTVSAVYPYRSAIYVDDSVGSHRLNLGDLDEVIYQGAVEKFADIKVGDIVHYIYDEDNEHAILIVVRDAYTGKLIEITYDGKLKIDDKAFTATTTALSDAEGLVGHKVTVYLNKDGKVFKIEDLQGPAVTTFYGIVQAVSTRIVENAPAYFAKFLTVDGEVEYRVGIRPTVGKAVKVSSDTTTTILDDVTFSDLTPQFGLDSDGPIFKVAEEVYETATRGVWTVKVEGTPYTFVEDEVLWAEKTSEGYVQRPRPYPGDEVVLYVVGTEVKVGIVK